MIRVQKNTDGSYKTNHTTHTADLQCDSCGAVGIGVDMNANAVYVNDRFGNHSTIKFTCAQLGGTCTSETSWPITNGVGDAKEIALVKTA